MRFTPLAAAMIAYAFVALVVGGIAFVFCAAVRPQARQWPAVLAVDAVIGVAWPLSVPVVAWLIARTPE